MNAAQMQEKEIFEDILSSQKSITGTYGTFANECANAGIRQEFLNILNEEHQIEAQVFDEMHKRGWYPTPPADQKMIDQAKQKYQSNNMQ